jgi:hypothetical protein
MQRDTVTLREFRRLSILACDVTLATEKVRLLKERRLHSLESASAENDRDENQNTGWSSQRHQMPFSTYRVNLPVR